MRHFVESGILDDHTESLTFTLGIRRKTGTEYHDLRTYNLNVRSNLDSTRDVQLVHQDGESKLYTDNDYLDVADQNTNVYWSGSTFSDPLDFFIPFTKANGARDDIEVVGGEFDFIGDPDDSAHVTDNEIVFYKRQDGIKIQDNIGVIQDA